MNPAKATKMSDFLVELLQTYGAWAVAAGAVLYLFLKCLGIFLDEDKSDLWRGRFYRAAFWLTGKRDKEKKYISNDVKGRLNLARRKMHFGATVLPTAVDVEWVEGGRPEAYSIKEGEFIVRLDPAQSQTKNITTLAVLLVQKTTLRGLRSSLDDSLTCAVDMNLAKNLLFELGNREVMDWFLANEYERAIHCTSACEKISKQLRVLEERGFFTRLFLVEMEELSQKVYGLGPTEAAALDVAALIEFLYTLATKKAKRKIPLDLNGTYLRIGVILVAKTGTILNIGIDPYIQVMESKISEGKETVYLLALDKEWLGEVDISAYEEFKGKISDLRTAMLTRTMAGEDFVDEFTMVDSEGNRRRGTCIRYKFP